MLQLRLLSKCRGITNYELLLRIALLETLCDAILITDVEWRVVPFFFFFFFEVIVEDLDRSRNFFEW